ncbi:MAG: hypothetical protein OEV52_04770 [Dehalococcoidia bacterium]|nr:hypothetical protein [Dehalococcoidia bacterium]MDH4291122.1 hypothetical protein [Dehalococcoidia bacterium]
MKTVLSLRKDRYVERLGLSLIVIALIAGMVGTGCGTSGYELTMAADPAAGGTATDETKGSPYAEGTIVKIKAEAKTGYQFVSWTAPAGTFGNANAASTIFAMPTADVTVTANFAAGYDLSMAVNPAGGGTATDLFDASPYAAGTVVSIQAEADWGCQFVTWTAPAGTFADANAEETTFTVPAQDVTVTANFQPPADHFKFYQADSDTYIGEAVHLEDEFGTVGATVGSCWGFGDPVEKVHDYVWTPIWSADRHFTVYNLTYEEEPQVWYVGVNNQFGETMLTVYGPVGLCVPTQQEGHDAPVALDYFLLYEVTQGRSVEAVVSLSDQFGDETVTVYEPAFFANPVRIIHEGEVTEILYPEVHGVLYRIQGGDFQTEVQVVNQFGEQTLNVHEPALLAVPSEKISTSVTEPLAVAAVLGDYDSQLSDLLRVNNIWAEERDWDVISDIGDYDVVVVNRPDDPGSTYFQAFLDAASDNGVGVVFTSSWGTWRSWGISLLEWYSGDPAGHSTDYDSGDVYYKVTQEHPIFAGWDVGDEITIITGGDCDHAWFWDYSGDTIAEVGSADSGIQGDAVAVGTYGGSTHVLLASLGPQDWTNVAHWIDDGKTIFINAVFFAAPSPL